jgi:hypothetical protein
MVNAIRCTGATRIEPHMPREGRQPIEKPQQPWLVPHQIDREIRRSADQHIDRPVTDNLVGDTTAVEDRRVPGS